MPIYGNELGRHCTVSEGARLSGSGSKRYPRPHLSVKEELAKSELEGDVPIVSLLKRFI